MKRKKIAIVTGASSGIGREFTIQIADRFSGIDEIWVVARRKGRLMELSKEVPSKLKIISADLSSRDDRELIAKKLEEESPSVRILINSAGYGKIGNVGDIDRKTEAGMVAVNCEALCEITSMVLPYMPDKSRIIQMASAAAFMPQPKFAVYAAGKAFVLSYSRALNEELKPRKICVTAVCPGPVKTEFFDIAETEDKIPLYKKVIMARPEKVAARAVKDSLAGKTISVYGFTMKSFRVLCKLLPHKLLLNIMEIIS